MKLFIGIAQNLLLVIFSGSFWEEEPISHLDALVWLSLEVSKQCCIVFMCLYLEPALSLQCSSGSRMCITSNK